MSLRRAQSRMANSPAGRETTSLGPGGADIRKVKITIWPEFNESDINAEKWEIAHKAGGKEKDKGKSPLGHNLFEDPEGKPEMPTNVRPSTWKRPFDISVEKTPTVVDLEYQTKFDLITPNKHIMHSEIMRFIISQINALWNIKQIRNQAPSTGEPVETNWDEVVYSWKPWEHIFAINKIAKEKGPYIPAYNPFGKYVVRLFWMGCWRKLVVDDQMPFDEKDQLLLPATSNVHELWPMLLSKAILKIIMLDTDGSDGNLELGDNNVIHMLTGWLPELVPLHPTIAPDVWTMLKQFLPEFKLPPPPSSQQQLGEHQNIEAQASLTAPEPVASHANNAGKHETKPQASNDNRGKSEATGTKGKGEKESKPGNKAEVKGKDSKPLKDKDKAIKNEEIMPENREVVVFAYYNSYPKGVLPVGMLRKMAVESETLRNKGLSQLGTHMVWLKQCRACPLEPPPPPEVVPAWKMIRPRKPKVIPADLPNEKGDVVDPNKPIQSLEMSSPFIGTPFWTYEQEKLELERRAAKLSIAEEGDDGETEEEVPQTAALEPEALAQQQIQQPMTAQPNEAAVVTNAGEASKGKPPVVTPNKVRQSSIGSNGEKRPSNVRQESAQKPEAPNGATQQRTVVEPSVIVAAEVAPSETNAPTFDDVDTMSLAPDEAERISTWLRSVPPPVPEGDIVDNANAAAPGSANGPPVGSQTTEDDINLAPPEPTLAEQMRSTWLDFEDFMACFKYVVIYHKTNTYPHVKTLTDIKGQIVSRDRRIPSSQSYQQQGLQSEDKTVYFLTVDSLEPIELVFCVSAICKWPELTNQQTIRTARDNESVSETMSMTGGAQTSSDPPPNSQVSLFSGNGELIVERHSWKSLASGSTILRLHTNALRATALILPAGRHVLRLVVGAPLAYHLTVASMASFALGDEDFVMQNLTKESLRYVDTANRIVYQFISCLGSFGRRPAYSQAFSEMMRLAVPVEPGNSRRRIASNFISSLSQATKPFLGDAATPEMAFGWRVLFQDPNAPWYAGAAITSRPGTSLGLPGSKRMSANNKEKESASGGSGPPGQAKEKSEHASKEKTSIEKTGGGKTKKEDDGQKGKKESANVQSGQTAVTSAASGAATTGIPNNYIFSERSPTAEEVAAIVKLQKLQRGAASRKVMKANKPGSSHFEKATASMVKMAEVLQPHSAAIATSLFKSMFSEDPDLLRHYPFFDDEWNRIAYCDFSGSYPEQYPNAWFLLFREIFFVKQPNLVVPRLICSLSPAFLRVIDNDTGEEVERVFCRVAPHNYMPNKRGYTVLGEARGNDSGNALAGRWRLRLIGSYATLPQPLHPELVSSFCIRELRDYYVPNIRNVICRYTVRVQSQHLTTIYAAASETGAEILVEIFDKDRLVQSAQGKGAALIPAFIFIPDTEVVGEAEELAPQPPPQATAKAVGKSGSTVSNSARPTSRGGMTARSPSPKNSRNSRPSSRTTSPIANTELVTHRWIVQVSLVNPTTWTFGPELEPWFENLRDQAKQEMKLNSDNEQSHGNTSIKIELTQRVGASGAEKLSSAVSSKEAKDSKMAKATASVKQPKGRDKDHGDHHTSKDKRESKVLASRPPSVGFDEQKPHSLDEIEVSRDTNKVDEIRAMKRAWEEAEPGRAAKARQSRLNYLRSRGVPVDQILAENSGPNAAPDAVDKALAKVALPDVDFSPFTRVWTDLTPEERRILDPETRQQVVAEYATAETAAMEFLETDKQIRQFLKTQQIAEYDRLQEETDKAWQSLIARREAIRTRLLEEERLRQEAEAAALAEQQAKEAALAAEQAAAAKAKRGSTKGKKKK